MLVWHDVLDEAIPDYFLTYIRKMNIDEIVSFMTQRDKSVCVVILDPPSPI